MSLHLPVFEGPINPNATAIAAWLPLPTLVFNQSKWIERGNRIITDVRVGVDAAIGSDRIGLDIPTSLRIIVPIVVVIYPVLTKVGTLILTWIY